MGRRDGPFSPQIFGWPRVHTNPSTANSDEIEAAEDFLVTRPDEEIGALFDPPSMEFIPKSERDKDLQTDKKPGQKTTQAKSNPGEDEVTQNST